jgi:hypothetical protein
MTTKLSAAEVKEIIATAMSARLGTTLTKEDVTITFKEDEETVGVFEGEHTETVIKFTGAKIRERKKK